MRSSWPGACGTCPGVDPVIAPGRRVIHIHFYSLQWARLMWAFGKRDQKHLPDRYQCGNPDYLRGLLDGLVDSDGHMTTDGRLSFHNTARQLTELFNVLVFRIHGSFPACRLEAGTAGGLPGVSATDCRPSYRSRLDAHHVCRHTERHQVLKRLAVTNESMAAVPVYDIEVDCPTHSFIADNAIVHNSICTTRIVSGVGVPQVSGRHERRIGGRSGRRAGDRRRGGSPQRGHHQGDRGRARAPSCWAACSPGWTRARGSS